ncbi:putative type VI secretion system effector [Rahnella aquatilis]|uniref:putative type VI secretion system effector n=1 Tax=Rahnella aquatilis TaxID=34038 RepID=UPI0036504F9B
MENETEKELINYTSCLRSEYKDPARLSGCRESLVIYVKSCQDQIDEYDHTHGPSGKAEPVQETWKKDYIDDVRECLIRAKEYLRQVEAEKNSFPPLPELPPTKPLIKISGIVEELSVKKVIGYFDFSEYSTEKARAEEKIKRDNEGASLLLLLQFFAGDAPHARFNDGRRKESQCNYVTGRVDGKAFSGWLRHTNMQVGDYVEIAAMPENNEYRIYAVANPKTRIISTTQNCHFGRKYSNVKEFTVLTGIFYTSIFIFLCLLEFPTLEKFFYALLTIFFLTFTTTFFITRGIKNENRAPGELFEKICNVLEISNGETLNLAKYSRHKIKKIKKTNNQSGNEKVPSAIIQTLDKGIFDVFYYPVKDNLT